MSADKVKILNISNAGQIMSDLFSNEERSAVNKPTLNTIIKSAQNCIFTLSRMVKLSIADSKVNRTDTTKSRVGKFIQFLICCNNKSISMDSHKANRIIKTTNLIIYKTI